MPRDKKGRFIKGYSYSVATQFTKENMMGENNHKFIKDKPTIKCGECGIEIKVAPHLLGKKKYCSKRCANKGQAKVRMAKYDLGAHLRGKKHSEETKRKMRKAAKRGKDNPNWKGGVTSRKKQLRMSWMWKEWRDFVFKRDNYTCRECNKRGCYIEPHHIIPLRVSEEKIFDVDNGITLCRDCHMKTMGHEEEFIERYKLVITQPL